VTAGPASFSPPGWSEYRFGPLAASSPPPVRHLKGTTDAQGSQRLRLDPPGVDRATELIAQATVHDVNRQAWSSSVPVLVHPARLYVGLKNEENFVAPGQPMRLQAVVTDLEGRPVAGRPVVVRVGASRLNLVSGQGPVAVKLPPGKGGLNEASAIVKDEQGRSNRTDTWIWVEGGKPVPQATLVSDRAEYQPGEVARLMVRAPFAPAHGILTLSRDGVVRQQAVRSSAGLGHFTGSARGSGDSQPGSGGDPGGPLGDGQGGLESQDLAPPAPPCEWT